MSFSRFLGAAGATALTLACSGGMADQNLQPPDPLGSRVETFQTDRFIHDAHGVIQPVSGRKWSEPVYHPTTIARYAMGLYRHWLETGDRSALVKALIQTDYLAANLQCENGRFSVLKYPYPGSFDLPPGWHSAMGQGLAIAALSQLASLSDSQGQYEKAIDCAIEAYRVDVSSGGVLTVLDEDAWWYEEYPASIRPKVLNGHIFALVGLWYRAKEGDKTAGQLLQKGANAVARYLSNYDAGFISRYAWTDEPNLLSPRRYNHVHIDQLLWLWHVTGNRVFFDYANRFMAYQDERLSSFRVLDQHGRVRSASGLDDSKTWYAREGFSVGDLPVTAQAKLPYDARVYRIAIFSFGHSEELDGVDFHQDGKPLEVIPRPALTFRHKTGKYETTVFIYDVPAAEKGRHYSVRFSQPNTNGGDTLALREIDWQFDQGKPVYERYKTLMERNQWQGSARAMPES